MNHYPSMFFCIPLIAIILFWSTSLAEEKITIKLPKPQMEGGKPLLETIKNRQSIKQFSTQNLTQQTLSNLLWAAWGINRPESGRRTAPSAVNKQEVDIYVFNAEGVYLYDAKTHQLQQTMDKDLRAMTGTQDYVASAALNLVYVVNLSRSLDNPEDIKIFYAAITAGCIIQNVYLFCASEGLAAVVRASVDKPTLAKAINLGDDQRILIAQTVGYAGEE